MEKPLSLNIINTHQFIIVFLLVTLIIKIFISKPSHFILDFLAPLNHQPRLRPNNTILRKYPLLKRCSSLESAIHFQLEALGGLSLLYHHCLLKCSKFMRYLQIVKYIRVQMLGCFRIFNKVSRGVNRTGPDAGRARPGPNFQNRAGRALKVLVQCIAKFYVQKIRN